MTLTKINKRKTHSAIVEKATEHVIYRNVDHEEVKRVNKKLKGGAGFRGWTPAFFTMEGEKVA